MLVRLGWMDSYIEGDINQFSEVRGISLQRYGCRRGSCACGWMQHIKRRMGSIYVLCSMKKLKEWCVDAEQKLAVYRCKTLDSAPCCFGREFWHSAWCVVLLLVIYLENGTKQLTVTIYHMEPSLPDHFMLVYGWIRYQVQISDMSVVALETKENQPDPGH